MKKYLYIYQDKVGELGDIDIYALKERHKIILPDIRHVFNDSIDSVINSLKPSGIIFQLDSGLPTSAQLKASRKYLTKAMVSIWFYWKEEQALEFINEDQLRHYEYIRKLIPFLKISQFLFLPLFKLCLSVLQKYRMPKPLVKETQTNPSSFSESAPQYTHNDIYKNEIQNQWDHNPCGSQYADRTKLHTLDWFLEVENYRYETYAPWMKEVMEFANYKQHHVLELGGGIGTDLAQFAKHGAYVTDLDLSFGHLNLAQENFSLRQLPGTFCHGDAEKLPFADNYFDLIYSNGVIHHTPNTQTVINEMWRVLKPGGKIIIMVYARNSFHYWRLILFSWFFNGWYKKYSIGEMMSRVVEKTTTNTKPLVKVYSKKSLAKLFNCFDDIHIVQRQLTKNELLFFSKVIPVDLVSKFAGWNLILKARKAEVN